MLAIQEIQLETAGICIHPSLDIRIYKEQFPIYRGLDVERGPSTALRLPISKSL